MTCFILNKKCILILPDTYELNLQSIIVQIDVACRHFFLLLSLGLSSELCHFNFLCTLSQDNSVIQSHRSNYIMDLDLTVV